MRCRHFTGLEAVHGQEEFLGTFGAHPPAAIRAEHDTLAERIHDAVPTADLRGRDVGH